jgi:hypothetical protein
MPEIFTRSPRFTAALKAGGLSLLAVIGGRLDAAETPPRQPFHDRDGTAGAGGREGGL